MSTARPQFPLSSRLLHWTMAAMILITLGIGVTMVASMASYHALISIHRLLGIAILLLVIIRFVNRLLYPPPLPATMSRMEHVAATSSEWTLYALMFLLPLIGWAMLSAAGYPIILYGSVRLPAILSHNLPLYAVLRQTHAILAYALFLMFLAHPGAILFHTLIERDGILERMVPWSVRPRETASTRAAHNCTD